MKIGDIELGDKPLFLAPMEDVTDASFRYICKKFGADVLYTEFISSDGLIRDALKSVQKLTIYDYERPIGIQLYGHLLDAMVESAKIAEEANPDIIDINFGCPVNKIARRGAGAGMLQNIPLMVEITAAIVKAVKKPVTVKTRLGWDEESICINDVAERLQDVGIQALTIHGRTRAQLYKGVANWEHIASVKDNPRIHIPIIGNGDISTPQEAERAFSHYGVDGVMIGRATVGKPWLFRDIKHFFANGQVPDEPCLREKVMMAREHFQKSIDIKGDKVGVLEMRRHFSNYFKGLPNFKETRLKLVTSMDINEIFGLLEYIDRQWGDVV